MIPNTEIRNDIEAAIVREALERHRAAELKKQLQAQERARKAADAAKVEVLKQGERDAVLAYWRRLRSENHPDKGGDTDLVIYTAACKRLDALRAIQLQRVQQ